MDASTNGDLILVTNGVYQVGGRAVAGSSVTNRVVVDRAVTVQSVNGPSATIIQGFRYSVGFGDNTLRCVYLTNDAMIAGFTLTNGCTLNVGWPTPTSENCGGGVWCAAASGVISNCVLGGNLAYIDGGAAYGGTLLNCTLINNTASIGGGGAFCTLSNCMVVGNSASIGAGVAESTLDTCTITKNTCPGNNTGGGGAYNCTLNGCMITTNSASSGAGVDGGTLNNCSVIGNTATVQGGGVSFCTLSNCTLIGNVVNIPANGNLPATGGGAFSCTLNRCTLSGNQVANPVGDTRQTLGGGAAGGTLNNCVLLNNMANWYFGGGGGAYNATLNNCTVAGNSTYAHGGGTYNCTANNSIVRFNGVNYFGGSLNYCCTQPTPGGPGNFSADPLFINQAGGNVRLQPNSPCINAGNNTYVTSAIDFDGNPRIQGGTVDIGAYEYQTPSSVLSYAWAQQYGLPTDGSADYANPDGDGLNTYQEWIAGTDPTNALSTLLMLSPTNGTPGINVSWESASGKTYFLERSTNLAAQPSFSALQSNLVGQTGTTIYTDTTATNSGPYFYRVGVQQ